MFLELGSFPHNQLTSFIYILPLLAYNYFMCNVGKTMINHPFGNALYKLSMVICGMVYHCFTHIIFIYIYIIIYIYYV